MNFSVRHSPRHGLMVYATLMPLILPALHISQNSAPTEENRRPRPAFSCLSKNVLETDSSSSSTDVSRAPNSNPSSFSASRSVRSERLLHSDVARCSSLYVLVSTNRPCVTAGGGLPARLWCAFTTDSMAVGVASSLTQKPRVRPPCTGSARYASFADCPSHPVSLAGTLLFAFLSHASYRRLFCADHRGPRGMGMGLQCTLPPCRCTVENWRGDVIVTMPADLYTNAHTSLPFSLNLSRFWTAPMCQD